ncbi:MAG TPA: hypothetical protein VFY67_02110 [Pyrinomonadaceae bacterium]|nr:hypothetical protein [Pyrinomonadaceae bacterium]
MTTPKVTNRKDILLLLLYTPGKTARFNEPIIGRTRLMKMLFLFREEALTHFRQGSDITTDNFYDFFPWDFGPFSSQVYDDLMFFILRGFIEPSPSSQEALPESEEEWAKWLDESGADDTPEDFSPFEEQTFKLTLTGETFTKPMYEALSSSQQRLLKEFKAKLSSSPLRAILRYVYKKYPDQISQSKIREAVLA